MNQPISSDKPISRTVWSRLDVKSWAITEFTLRQYKTRKSTWAVGGVGLLLIFIVMLFYVKGQTAAIQSYDQDGDSVDWDGDGYTLGQEMQYGTDPSDPLDYPAVPALPAEYWIDEDDFSYVMDGETCQRNLFGITDIGECQLEADDDGDCERDGWPLQNQLFGQGGKDSNYDGNDCSVFIKSSNGISVFTDSYVDEDPDDERYFRETVHRAFMLGFGKIGFTFILGIFLPLFLASGLIRDEMESETLHYLVGKPLARSEFYAYRLGGYVLLTWSYLAVLVTIIALISGIVAPSSGLFRIGDIQLWAAILFASWMMVLVYGTIFSTFGIVSRLGMLGSIFIGIWELMMAILTLTQADFFVTRLSVVFWGLQIIDAASVMTWTDTEYLIERGTQLELEGSAALSGFYGVPSIGSSPVATILISSMVLLLTAAAFFTLGQSTFKRKELK